MKPYVRRVSLTCRRCERAATMQLVDTDGQGLDAYYCDEHAEGALLDYLKVLKSRPLGVLGRCC
jgi:hypothetical protein